MPRALLTRPTCYQLLFHQLGVRLVTSTARAAGASTASLVAGTAAHDTGATDGDTAHGLSAIRMLCQSTVFHALFDLKALGLVTFKLRDRFVNVGRHKSSQAKVSLRQFQRWASTHISQLSTSDDFHGLTLALENDGTAFGCFDFGCRRIFGHR